MFTFVEMEWQFSWHVGIFLGANVALLIAYLYCYLPPIIIRKKSQESSFNLTVSILVCARNEADNLRNNIPLWCAQEDVSFEVIIVNDHSSDGSGEVLRKNAEVYDCLKWIDSDSPLSVGLGKKHALIQAVRAATGDVLLLTDADCAPESLQWAYTMAQRFDNEEIGAVAGYAPVGLGSKGLLARLQFLDAVVTALQCFSTIRMGRPFMVVGRNVAYRATAYPLDELVQSMRFISGDDDLVFQALDPKWQVHAQVDRRALVRSKAKADLYGWFRQKRRHFSVAHGYQVRKSWLPALFRILQMCWIASLLLGFTALYSGYILLSLLPISGLVYVLYSWQKVLQIDRPIAAVFLEPLRYLVVVCVTLSLLIKRPTKW